jgi:hypothetical protein
MSDNNKDPFLKGAVWLGLVLIVPSAIYMFVILNAEAESFDLAPRWIAFSAILIFFNCGILVGLMDSGFNEFRETWWLSYLHGMSGLSIPLIFLMLFNWVSFGPGTREFSGSISIPFLSFSFEGANQILGRIVFAIPTLFMDLVMFLVIYQMIAEFFGKKVDFLKPDEEKDDKD